jgi:predicted nucleic acid-binding protein
MTTYFFDTSAIVKRYAPSEPGHASIVSLCDPTQGHTLFLSQVALVEVVAAICRKAREQGIAEVDRDRLISRFRRDVRNDYDLWRVTTAVYTVAGDLSLISTSSI